MEFYIYHHITSYFSLVAFFKFIYYRTTVNTYEYECYEKCYKSRKV